MASEASKPKGHLCEAETDAAGLQTKENPPSFRQTGWLLDGHADEDHREGEDHEGDACPDVALRRWYFLAAQVSRRFLLADLADVRVTLVHHVLQFLAGLGRHVIHSC